MLNNIILQGHLVRDVETKTTNSGISIVTFTIAWNRKISEENEKSLYIDCEAWRGTAELISKNFKKGNEIIVEGELYTNTYQNESGENRYRIKLNVNRVHFTSGNNKSENTTETNNKTNKVAQKFEPVDEDNLPF